MLKMTSIYTSKKQTKVEAKGPRFEIGDFCVKLGSVTMSGTFKGILVEVYINFVFFRYIQSSFRILVKYAFNVLPYSNDKGRLRFPMSSDFRYTYFVYTEAVNLIVYFTSPFIYLSALIAFLSRTVQFLCQYLPNPFYYSTRDSFVNMTRTKQPTSTPRMATSITRRFYGSELFLSPKKRFSYIRFSRAAHFLYIPSIASNWRSL